MKKKFVPLLSFLCLTACNKQTSELLPWVKTISFVEDSELPCEIICSCSNDTVTPNFLDFNSDEYSISKEDFEKVLSYLNSLSFKKTNDDIAPGSSNYCVEIAIPSSNNGIKEYERYCFSFSDGITCCNGNYYKVSNTKLPNLTDGFMRSYFKSHSISNMKVYDLEDGEKEVTNSFSGLDNFGNIRFVAVDYDIANLNDEEQNSFSRYEFRNEHGKIRFYSDKKFSIFTEIDDYSSLKTFEIVNSSKYNFQSLKNK